MVAESIAFVYAFDSFLKQLLQLRKVLYKKYLKENFICIMEICWNIGMNFFKTKQNKVL